MNSPIRPMVTSTNRHVGVGQEAQEHLQGRAVDLTELHPFEIEAHISRPQLHDRPVELCEEVGQIVGDEVDYVLVQRLGCRERRRLEDGGLERLHVTPALAGDLPQEGGGILGGLALQGLGQVVAEADGRGRADVRDGRHGGCVGRGGQERAGGRCVCALGGYVYDHGGLGVEYGLDDIPGGVEEASGRVQPYDQHARAVVGGFGDGPLHEPGGVGMDCVVQVDHSDVGISGEYGRNSLGDYCASQAQHHQTDCNCASHSPGFSACRAAAGAAPLADATLRVIVLPVLRPCQPLGGWACSVGAASGDGWRGGALDVDVYAGGLARGCGSLEGWAKLGRMGDMLAVAS